MSPFGTDRHSGSGDVAAGLLRHLTSWANTDRSRGASELRAALLDELRRAQAAQPSMALVHQIAARALRVADAGVTRGDSSVELRTHLIAALEAERADLEAGRAGVARWASELVRERGAWIATLSSSADVRAAMTETRRAGREPRALVAEGRPLFEGRAQAAALAEAGIPTWLVVDAALPMLLAQATMVWIGADAVTERGVLNKIGSFALALAAREHSVPLYALASRRKYLPAATPALSIVEHPGSEVWDAPAPGVQARNVYFELVPLALFRGFVVEDAVLAPGEAATVAADRALPEALRGAVRAVESA